MPLWRFICRRFALIDSPGHRKIHDQPVPLAGGLAVTTGLVSAGLFWWAVTAIQVDWPFASELANNLRQHATRFSPIVGGAMGMFLLGLMDDRFELRPPVKFLGQLLVAIGIASSGIQWEVWPGQPILQFAITVLWILTVTNAFNFIDNMNGLCAGLCVIASLATACIAGQADELFFATVAVALSGAALGFLPCNYPKASAFLGDSGSHLIGYTLAVMTIETMSRSGPEGSVVSIVAASLILVVPLADLGWVVCYRTWKRKPFYVGDNNHLSHLLVRFGLPRSIAVAVLWSVAALGGLLGIFLR